MHFKKTVAAMTFTDRRPRWSDRLRSWCSCFLGHQVGRPACSPVTWYFGRRQLRKPRARCTLVTVFSCRTVRPGPPVFQRAARNENRASAPRPNPACSSRVPGKRRVVLLAGRQTSP